MERLIEKQQRGFKQQVFDQAVAEVQKNIIAALASTELPREVVLGTSRYAVVPKDS